MADNKNTSEMYKSSRATLSYNEIKLFCEQQNFGKVTAETPGNN